MKSIHLEIVTPSKVAFTGEIISVTVPGSKGSFQVLFNHAPLMSSLEIGSIKIEEVDGTKKMFACGGGSIEILNNRVLILAECFEAREEIDVARAEKARERAKKRLKERTQDLDVPRAEAALARAINRIKLAEKN